MPDPQTPPTQPGAIAKVSGYVVDLTAMLIVLAYVAGIIAGAWEHGWEIPEWIASATIGVVIGREIPSRYLG